MAVSEFNHGHKKLNTLPVVTERAPNTDILWFLSLLRLTLTIGVSPISLHRLVPFGSCWILHSSATKTSRKPPFLGAFSSGLWMIGGQSHLSGDQYIPLSDRKTRRRWTIPDRTSLICRPPWIWLSQNLWRLGLTRSLACSRIPWVYGRKPWFWALVSVQAWVLQTEAFEGWFLIPECLFGWNR